MHGKLGYATYRGVRILDDAFLLLVLAFALIIPDGLMGSKLRCAAHWDDRIVEEEMFYYYCNNLFGLIVPGRPMGSKLLLCC
jgi:hypothetical protein